MALWVVDLDRTTGFYAGVLGLPVERRWADAAGRPRSVWLTLGGGARLMLERAEQRPAGAGGWSILALTIRPEERDRWRAHLATQGVPITHETEHTLYVEDPEGNRVALSHWPPPDASAGAPSPRRSNGSRR